MEIFFCSKCGAELRNDSKFCSKCGNVIVRRGDEINNEAIKGENKNGKLIFVAVVVVFLLVGAGVLGAIKVSNVAPQKNVVASSGGKDSKNENVQSRPLEKKDIDISKYEQVAYDKLVTNEEKYISKKIWVSGIVEAILEKDNFKHVVLVVSPKTDFEAKRVAIVEIKRESNDVSIPEIGMRVKTFGIFQRNSKEYRNYAPQVAQVPVVVADKISNN